MLYKFEFGRKRHGNIILATVGIGVYEYILIWRANCVRILENYTRDVWLPTVWHGPSH